MCHLIILEILHKQKAPDTDHSAIYIHPCFHIEMRMCGTRDKSAHTSIIINVVSTIHKVRVREKVLQMCHTQQLVK